MTELLIDFVMGRRNRTSNAEEMAKFFLCEGLTHNQLAGAVGNAVKRGDLKVVGREFCYARKRWVNVFAMEV